mgnify:CR=1 FL=1
MIDISQLTALISAFRVETEKESISPETVGKILQDIADLLATVPSENDFNILRFWKETLQQYRFLYDIQQRNVEDHSNVILSLMARSLLDGAASSLTLAIGPASATRAGVLTAEDFLKLQNLGSYTDDLVDTLLEMQDVVDGHNVAINRMAAAGYVLQYFQNGSYDGTRITFAARCCHTSTPFTYLSPPFSRLILTIFSLSSKLIS